MRAIAYTRVATAAQLAASEDARTRMRELAERVCRERGWKLDGTEVDKDAGASTASRYESLLRLLGDARHGRLALPGVLIVESLARLGRDPAVLVNVLRELAHGGIGLMTLDPERYYPPESLRDAEALADVFRLAAGETERAAGLEARRRRQQEGRPITKAERQVGRVARRLAVTFRRGLGTREALQEAVNELLRLEQEL